VRIAFSAIVLSGLPLFVQAADWQLLAETEISKVRIDAASISRQAPYKTVTVMHEFNKSQRQTDPPKVSFDRRQDSLLIDCAVRSLALAEAVFYEAGAVVDTRKKDPADVKFIVATPESMVEKVVNAVCDAGRKK
jgi:hypothetical protein